MIDNTHQQLIDDAQVLRQELNIDKLKKQIADLQTDTLNPDFWERADAQELMQELSFLENQLDQCNQLEKLANNLKSLDELHDDNLSDLDNEQLEIEVQQTVKKLRQLIKELSINKYLSGKFDKSNAILSIHPGQGGTEAMDWAEMLERMYIRFFERKDWKFEFISETKGEEAGIKEVSFEVKAPFAYGYLKNERGTHRLVRLSPFNADNLRQTSFALVEVLPVISNQTEIDLKDEELSWKFTRAGGPGGQAVNKINTAVELTHLPTNITIKSRNSRSQSQNKETALKMLTAKLALIQEEKLQEKIDQEKGQHQNASWGTQIRNYVLHPYQLVKDTRTQVETSDTQGVLDGDLDLFIEEEIKLK